MKLEVGTISNLPKQSGDVLHVTSNENDEMAGSITMMTTKVPVICLLSLCLFPNVFTVTLSRHELNELLSSINIDPLSTKFIKTYYDALNTTGRNYLTYQDVAPIYKAMDRIGLTFATEGRISRSAYIDSVKAADSKARIAVEKLYDLFDEDGDDVIDRVELDDTLRPRVLFSYIDLLILGADTDGDKKVTEDEYTTHLATADYVTGDAHKAFLNGNFLYADLDDNKVVELKDVHLLFPSITAKSN
ncbi:hypothetical protein Btru_029253 [Bulinus truncatus]|nr:hypothetical protein Btru_029253 [Bulinus truncatus]